jgi:hypothetical protein
MIEKLSDELSVATKSALDDPKKLPELQRVVDAIKVCKILSTISYKISNKMLD